ncbi:MAG TPA: phosphoribosyltransferase [Patescibacteria group bacterium]|nr:phosphoribosyltransferase [Patescibacteria group bacterium]
MLIQPNWEEWKTWLSLLYSLIKKIADHYSEESSDIIMVPAMNGGMVPSGIIAGELGIKDVRPVSIGREGEIRFFIWPEDGNIGDIRRRRVLIVEDDVRQGGRSPKFLREALMQRGAAEVLVACIFKYKDSAVDFFAEEVDIVPKHPWKPANPGDRK